MNRVPAEQHKDDVLRFAAELLSRLVRAGRSGQYLAAGKAPEALAYDGESASVVLAVHKVICGLGISLRTVLVEIDTSPINDFIFDRSVAAAGLFMRRSPELFEPAHQALREIVAQLPPRPKPVLHRVLAVQGAFDTDGFPVSLCFLESQTIKIRGNGRVRVAGMSVLPDPPASAVDYAQLGQIVLQNRELILPQPKRPQTTARQL